MKPCQGQSRRAGYRLTIQATAEYLRAHWPRIREYIQYHLASKWVARGAAMPGDVLTPVFRSEALDLGHFLRTFFLPYVLSNIASTGLLL
jgi:hypothetical protein